MMTVKEISELTGISVRTLHYYDEIGLLSPSEKSEVGYRLYDDKALERLQQILFFREFEISLKEIKRLMDDPSLDKEEMLQLQKKMLIAKRARLKSLIDSIDNILKGENKMDFEIFNQSEIEMLWETTAERMPDFMKESIIDEFGSMDKWKEHYIQRTAKKDMQKGYQKLVEWYGGDKNHTLEMITSTPDQEVVVAHKNRIDDILENISKRRNEPVTSFEVRKLIGEYGFVMKRFYQLQNEEGIMLSVASSYRDERVKKELDENFGSGAAEYFAEAIENFYTKR